MDCLKSACYGMLQSPKCWFVIFSMGIRACGTDPYDYDTCLIMVDHFLCVIYADGCILFPKEDKYIDALVEQINY